MENENINYKKKCRSSYSGQHAESKCLIIYEAGNKKIEVQIEKETIWLNLNQIAQLFDVKKAAISKHIKNIFSSGESNRASTVSILEQVAADGINISCCSKPACTKRATDKTHNKLYFV